jgi:hypothetical protein
VLDTPSRFFYFAEPEQTRFGNPNAMIPLP